MKKSYGKIKFVEKNQKVPKQHQEKTTKQQKKKNVEPTQHKQNVSKHQGDEVNYKQKEPLKKEKKMDFKEHKQKEPLKKEKKMDFKEHKQKEPLKKEKKMEKKEEKKEHKYVKKFLESQEKKKKEVQTYLKKKADKPKMKVNEKMQEQIIWRKGISKKIKEKKKELTKKVTDDLLTDLILAMEGIRDQMEINPVPSTHKEREAVIDHLVAINLIDDIFKKRKDMKKYKTEKPYLVDTGKQIKLFYKVLKDSDKQ